MRRYLSMYWKAILTHPSQSAMMLLGALVAGVSGLVSDALGDGQWFQRSGSICTAIGIWASGLELFESTKPFQFRSGMGGKPEEFLERELSRKRNSSRSKMLIVSVVYSVLGTIIWGYGDLIW